MSATALESDLVRSGIASVIAPAHQGFEKYRAIWNALFDKRPAAIVRAGSIDDIRKTIAVAARHQALLAVRGGGHSLPGLSTCDGGIVLDLSGLNRVTLDLAQGTADVEGGALLGDLDRATCAAGRVVPAGVVGHTGVAGLTLGGGMGWLSRKYGMTIDNLLGVEIVTADGRSLWVDATHEPELFWGLRGGGGNFGVVSRFRFKLRELGPVHAGVWTYPSAEAPQALRHFDELAAAAPRDLVASSSWARESLAVRVCWSGDPAAAEKAMAPYGKLAKAVTTQMGPVDFPTWQAQHDEALPWGHRHYSKGGFIGRFTADTLAMMAEQVAAAPNTTSDFYTLLLGGAVSDVDEEATAYSGRAASHYWIASATWVDKAQDAACLAWGRKAGTAMAARSLAGNYVNEQGDAGGEVAMQAYGAAKYRMLAALKAKFDPGNLFRLNQNIKPEA